MSRDIAPARSSGWAVAVPIGSSGTLVGRPSVRILAMNTTGGSSRIGSRSKRLALAGLCLAAIAGGIGLLPDSGGQHAARPTAIGAATAVPRPLRPEHDKDREDGEGGEADEGRKPFTPQSPNNHDLTALPLATAAVGPTWTSLGPQPIANLRNFVNGGNHVWGNAGGRVTALAVSPTNAAIAYAGPAGGGVWKTIDSGTTWLPTTDAQASLAIGALAI